MTSPVQTISSPLPIILAGEVDPLTRQLAEKVNYLIGEVLRLQAENATLKLRLDAQEPAIKGIDARQNETYARTVKLNERLGEHAAAINENAGECGTKVEQKLKIDFAFRSGFN
jgi:hypothetical protein